MSPAFQVLSMQRAAQKVVRGRGATQFDLAPPIEAAMAYRGTYSGVRWRQAVRLYERRMRCVPTPISREARDCAIFEALGIRYTRLPRDAATRPKITNWKSGYWNGQWYRLT